MNTVLKRREVLDIETPSEISRYPYLSETIIKILYARGLSDEQKIQKFLFPSEADMHDPFLLKGMQELCERLQIAMQENQTVVIYGDYDADGICATVILTDFLSKNGVNVVPYIPSRQNEGYGLSIEALSKIIEEFIPDLIVSCDCGISAKEEVEFVIDLGIDIYITDHHEIPENLPDCVIVNPKQNGQDYPFDMLCGAGVAFKVVQAIGGLKAASEYYDLCALATVADLVPLIDENRALVILGLAKINSSKVNTGLKMLIEFLGIENDISSSDIAYKISPRINAAGRMGDAYRAFELLTEKNSVKLLELIKDISLDNEKRRNICEQVHKEAIKILRCEDLINNFAIILSSPQWEKGLTSIVAAQLSNEFHRPTFLLVEVGDHYKGTARSVEGINLFGVLCSVSDLMMEFGGHSQAAGFSICKENLYEFKKRVNEYIQNNCPKESLLPYSQYDLEIDSSMITLQLAKDFDLLEPYGLGNPRPVLKLKANSLTAEFMKNKSQHLLVSTPEANKIVCFGYGKSIELMNVSADFELAVEISVNKFKSKEYVNIVLRDFNFSKISALNNTEKLECQAIKLLAYNGYGQPNYDIIREDELKNYIQTNRLYGTLLLTYDFENYNNINTLIPSNFVHNYIYSTTLNNYNRVVLGSDLDIPLDNYDTVIFLEKPLSDNTISYINAQSKAKVYVVNKKLQPKYLDNLDIERKSFVNAYSVLLKNNYSGDNFYSYYEKAITDGIISYKQLMLALIVFSELGLIEVEWTKFYVNAVKNIKAELSDSTILKLMEEIIKNLK